MVFFKTYTYKIVNYDFINTFLYKNPIQIPKLKKITLNFGYRKLNFKYFIRSLLALELISNKKGKITKSKRLNLFLKVKKGDPIGYKLVLKKNVLYFFYEKLGISIFSKIKYSKTPKIQWNSNLLKVISFQIKDPLLFEELEEYFYLLKNLPRLDILLFTNCKSQKELLFLLKSIKFWIKY